MASSRLTAAIPVLWLATTALAAAQGFGPPGGKPPMQPPFQPPPPMMQPGAAGSPSGNPAGFAPPSRFGFPGAQSPQTPPTQQPERQNIADELTDFGIPPQSQMQRNVGSPTPTTIPGGHIITTAEMRQAINTNVLIVDVLAGPPHPSLPSALMMPGAGDFGTFEDPIQQKLWGALSQATQMNPDRPIVFLCAGSRCWESYNAALRAERMGFRMVLWYRGGLAAWQAAGFPMSQPGGNGGPPPSARPGFPPG